MRIDLEKSRIANQQCVISLMIFQPLDCMLSAQQTRNPHQMKIVLHYRILRSRWKRQKSMHYLYVDISCFLSLVAGYF